MDRTRVLDNMSALFYIINVIIYRGQNMDSILTTPSGIQVHIVDTLIKNSERLAVPYLAKLIGRPRPVVDAALKSLQDAGLVRLDGDDAVLLKDDTP